METIKSYLDNMFAGLPKTTRVLDLKNDILSNMEEKYNELKRQGKSENEAIGIVISEFGNIDELVNELGIRKDESVASQPIVTKDEVEAYLSIKKTMGKTIGLGVFMCIIGPALLILIHFLLENGVIETNLSASAIGIPGVIILLFFITFAVGLFIYSGMNFERFKYMEDGVQLPGGLEAELRQRYDRFTQEFYFKLIISVCMLVFSPVSIFVTTMINDAYSPYGVVILLFIVACAVFLLVTTGTEKDSYDRLLKLGEYTVKNIEKKEDKVIGAVAAIVWPLAVIIFLCSGFIYGLWDKAWIIFPITGILFGMFSAAYSIITGKNQ